ncbi:hypothetical protein [Nesterenkonia marinintestina]|uniref:hypothetical protein n=1 Tax=Nesterenkonia marinintestina TaxID=2979865 RepID=UPI0021BE270B|nr:hypothetical protein [Nesterenkonia sp. GX14115]
MSRYQLTDADAAEGLRNAAAAVRHLHRGDVDAAFRTITYAPSFAAAVHGLLRLASVGLGDNKTTDEILDRIIAAQSLRANHTEDATDE